MLVKGDFLSVGFDGEAVVLLFLVIQPRRLVGSSGETLRLVVGRAQNGGGGESVGGSHGCSASSRECGVDKEVEHERRREN